MAGELSKQPGHVVDIMATCCDVAGAEYPSQRGGNDVHTPRGISLVPAFRDPSVVQPRTLYWEHERHAAIRDGKWKLVSLNGLDESQWRLYDLEKDRTEMHDQAASMPERVHTMKQQWTEWARQTNVLPWPSQRTRK